MCEDLGPNFGDKKNCLLHHDKAPSHTSFFTREVLTKTTRLSSPPTILSVFPIEDTIERPPFWQNWGDRGSIAGSAEHPNRTDAFKNGTSAGNGAYERKGKTSSVNVVVRRPKVSFWPDGRTSAGNYEWLFYLKVMTVDTSNNSNIDQSHVIIYIGFI
jgi:hypothetical protein